MSYKKIHPPHDCLKGKICYIDQNRFLYQAVNILFSAIKLGILTWGVYGIDSLLQPASSVQSMNCSLSYFSVGFKTEAGRLPLDWDVPLETMVALVTLVLQSTKKLFQKGKENKYEALCLEPTISHEALVLIPLSESDFANIQHWNDPCLWGCPV